MPRYPFKLTRAPVLAWISSQFLSSARTCVGGRETFRDVALSVEWMELMTATLAPAASQAFSSQWPDVAGSHEAKARRTGSDGVALVAGRKVAIVLFNHAGVGVAEVFGHHLRRSMSAFEG
jgi:hypothetical protein